MSISRIKYLLKKLLRLDSKLETNLFLNAKILRRQNLANYAEIIKDIQKAEFKVFSQHSDDGIIQFLVDYLDIENKSFVEFGVENYTESNTRYLLMENNWRGLIMDGSKKNIDYVKSENIYWLYDLTALDVFITKENINGLLEANGFSGEIGLLHIDIDGNDYWVWEAISVAQPIIVIIEYNSVFGDEKHWTIPYDKNFIRKNAHFSNLYYGASLAAIVQLSENKGYSFVGCNSAGNNAYFVKNGFEKKLSIQNTKSGFVLSKFRESRNEKGELTYLNKKAQISLLKGLPIFDTIQAKEFQIKSL